MLLDDMGLFDARGPDWSVAHAALTGLKLNEVSCLDLSARVLQRDAML
jgi:hypothetical protein